MRSPKNKKPGKPKRLLSAWQQSAEFREISRRAIMEFNRRKRRLPRCTAHSKFTGETCRNLAKPNGKCWRHGGLTPSGADWHKPTWPKPGPGQNKKATRKINALQKAAKTRERKLARMTDDERDAYQKWQRSHKPGPKGARARARKERQDAAAFKASIDMPVDRPPNPELDELEVELAAARRRAVDLEMNLANDEGIFG